jgi:voltage-gated potassium channel
VVELVLAEDRPRHVRSEWTSLAIVVAQALAIVPGLAAVGSLRALRGARVLRLVATGLRLAAVGGVAARRGTGLLRRHAAALALGTAGLTWITSAVVFTLAEDVGRTGRVSSFFDALWWSTCTITTVGYGDVYPVTTVGRLAAAFTMVVGVSAFAVITARVAQALVRSD